ncbi:SecY-interacting protein Syd [Cryobacterium sp. Hz9]|uniref:SecY-interacting protein Syd n=1 Tax=Cryobacterium sp. Hz9 TaxID=1259167 RepID=UPI00141AFDCF|nr:SecY-interacting protein Syd [Cryobacterium sp. Hz9]
MAAPLLFLKSDGWLIVQVIRAQHDAAHVVAETFGNTPRRVLAASLRKMSTFMSQLF